MARREVDADGNVTYVSDDAGNGNVTNDFGLETVNPAEVGGSEPGTGSGGTEPKRRGRKPGTKLGSTRTSAKVDISGLEKILLSAHLMLASAVKAPELAISPDEAKTLATATAGVAKHYDMGISEKAQDWANLIMVAGAIYGPRVFMMMNGKKNHGNN